MFLHIGEGKLLKKSDIVAVLDLETTSIGKKTKEFLRKCEKNKETEYLSYEIPITYVICEKKGKRKVYMTQLSSQTLYKRAERIEDFGTEN